MVLARSGSKIENQASVLLTFHHKRVSVSELDIAVVEELEPDDGSMS